MAVRRGGSRSDSRLTIQQRKENCKKMNIPIARDVYVSRAFIHPSLSLLPLSSCGGGVLFAASISIVVYVVIVKCVWLTVDVTHFHNVT